MPLVLSSGTFWSPRPLPPGSPYFLCFFTAFLAQICTVVCSGECSIPCGVFLIGYLLGSWVVKMIFWSPQFCESLVLYVTATFQHVLHFVCSLSSRRFAEEMKVTLPRLLNVLLSLYEVSWKMKPCGCVHVSSSLGKAMCAAQAAVTDSVWTNITRHPFSVILGIELRASDFLDILRPFRGDSVEREGSHVIQASLKLRILLFPLTSTGVRNMYHQA